MTLIHTSEINELFHKDSYFEIGSPKKFISTNTLSQTQKKIFVDPCY